MCLEDKEKASEAGMRWTRRIFEIGGEVITFQSEHTEAAPWESGTGAGAAGNHALWFRLCL